MGVRVVSNSRVHGIASPVVQRMFDTQRAGPVMSGHPHPTGTPSMEVHYDGSAGKQGCPSGLAANVGIVDTSTLMRSGTNLGITMSYTNGSDGQCVVEACNVSRELYSRLFSADSSDSADAATKLAAAPWTSVGIASANSPVQTEFQVYSLLRLTFTDGKPATMFLASR